jgi:hypothetical protein
LLERFPHRHVSTDTIEQQHWLSVPYDAEPQPHSSDAAVLFFDSHELSASSIPAPIIRDHCSSAA